MKSKKRVIILFFIILALAVAVRVIRFGEIPMGLNQDEASIGYDAFSIYRYGIDRNGNSYPVHLVAWGSGQNALYAYLLIPFIALFGLSITTVRLVNLIFGIISVAVMYFLVKELFDEKAGLWAMFLTAISPWHIMLTRWGLESNLFPAFFLIGAWLTVLSFRKQKLFPLAAFVLAVSMYSYGSAYFIVPLFCFAISIYIIIGKKIKPSVFVTALVVFFVFALPIFAFAAINVFGLDSIFLGPITIPRMTGVARIGTMTAHSSSGILSSFKYLYQMLILQYDGGTWNSIWGYGCIYLFSILFVPFGIVSTVKSKKALPKWIIFSWLILSVALFFVYNSVNINRINIIYLPMIILTAAGIASIDIKWVRKGLVVLYLAAFLFFSYDYLFKVPDRTADDFQYGLDDAVEYACSGVGDEETVYITSDANMPYVYVLFAEETPAHDYVDTVKFKDINVEFQQVESFSRYIFNISGAFSGEPGVYVMTDVQANAVSAEYARTDFGHYSVVEIG